MKATHIVFSYPLEEDKTLPIDEVFDWYDSQDKLWEATKVIWDDDPKSHSHAKTWWFTDSGGKLAVIGAGAYGALIVLSRKDY